MQIKALHFQVPVLCAFLFSAVFGLFAPASASATVRSLDNYHGYDLHVFCDMNDCQSRHESCADHCFDNSAEKTAFDAIIPSVQDEILLTGQLPDRGEHAWITEEMPHFYTSGLAPPTLIFLRSSIKRE